ncbi:hypothetical protein ACTXLQ_13925 [Enterococcus hirae]|uniref:hypothetical protein n=1 Tax=Enterococcus hirae TaxID=1354 RepID=UPI001880B6CD|nr:hypothetical protein [Enterococcus hirae]MBE8787203.1 hypothetical protein [Enterococcus hirae]MBE8805708.1 hypothetical protein [Enterococcus hirae]
MSSVTKRISEIKQPRGGYVKTTELEVHIFDDGQVLNEKENIHASIVGMAVDYLTRFIMGTDVKCAFNISFSGAIIAEQMYGQKNNLNIANNLLSNISGLDNKSIISACKMVTYDVWYRNPICAVMTKGVDETNPDIDTVHNIRLMVERSVKFWNEFGPIIKDGFTFEPDGYTQTVNTGDGDYLTKDTLWDFKVSKNKPNSKHTLQLLMYWIMGQHSGQEIYKSINRLGIFNPRLNTVYTININSISQETIKEVEKEVICY